MASDAENVSIWWRHHENGMAASRINQVSVLEATELEYMMTNFNSNNANELDDKVIISYWEELAHWDRLTRGWNNSSIRQVWLLISNDLAQKQSGFP